MSTILAERPNFQYLEGAIRAQLLAAATGLGKTFNTSKVRLEQETSDQAEDAKESFNTSKVRLERSVQSSSTAVWPSFNTSKVRLEHAESQVGRRTRSKLSIPRRCD